MNSSQRALALALFGAVVGACPPARGAAGACVGVTVDADGGVRNRWPALADDVRGAFAARADVDACARVKLTGSSAITAEVVLPDHRVASRSVSRPEDVVPTLEGLLVVPREAAEASPAPVATAVIAAPRGAAPDVAPPPRPAPDVTPAVARAAPPSNDALPSTPDHANPAFRDREGAFGIELSAAVAARLGDGQRSVGFGLRSYVEVARWLIGFEGRLDQYSGASSGSANAALALSALGGRRFELESLALDLVAGPSLGVTGNSEVAVARADARPPPVQAPEHGSRAAPRLLAAATLHFNRRSTFRTFVGVEGDVAMTSRPAPTDAAELPSWTVGLALGGTVGTR